MDSVEKRNKTWTLIEKAYPGFKMARKNKIYLSFDSCLRVLLCDLFFNNEIREKFSENEIVWLQSYCLELRKDGFF